jgi:hypothetical protein
MVNLREIVNSFKSPALKVQGFIFADIIFYFLFEVI